MHRYKTLLIFGAPGSGKGTQGRTLGTIPGFHHCACGDVFRGLDLQSKLGREFLKYSSKGKLVPDEITVELWVQWIEFTVESGQIRPQRDFLVLDGIPRNVGQAKLMKEYIDVKHIFHLSCPDREKLVMRLKSRALKENRLDDANEEIIRSRLITYDEESKPMLNYYGDSVRCDIDATLPPVEVLSHIINGVLLKAH
ncbi:MAG: adenylate kinase [Verrucomicrobia bacterium RIFCSPHIGHO2_12_FULL_41_10]|nr:MAG: adenylate kinase [Verrucomicrobia bacterium RIFCSPHIGHO2_12_FULL_41_10]HLB34664.1 nucleoside monophosphate kinase [Chthoniobacterales bacterium]